MKIEYIKEGTLEEALPFFPTTVKKAATWHEMEDMSTIQDFNTLKLLFPKDFVLIYKASQSMITKEMENPNYHYVSEEIPGRTGIADCNTLCFSFFHDKGQLLVGPSLMKAIVDLGGEPSKIKQYNNQDIEIDDKKVCGIGGRVINGKYTFEVGMIILIKDDALHREVLPDEEYYRVKIYDNEPSHIRLPCSGIIDEFPKIEREKLVEQFSKNIIEMYDNIETPEDIDLGVRPLKPYEELQNEEVKK